MSLAFKIFIFTGLLTGQVFAKTSSATIILQGVVPSVASLSTAGLPNDLDLRPGTSVSSAKIGQIQIKLNSEIAGVFLSSNTKSGAPENTDQQPFQVSRPFTVKVNKGCRSLNTNSGLVLDSGIKEISTDQIKNFRHRSATAGGIVENCALTASWASQPVLENRILAQQNITNQPRTGLYNMSITVTLVSQ